MTEFAWKIALLSGPWSLGLDRNGSVAPAGTEGLSRTRLSRFWWFGVARSRHGSSP